MRLVVVCVGLLFLLVVCSYAQNSAPETSTGVAIPAKAGNSNSSMGVASAAAQAQDQAVEPSSRKDTDQGSSEHHTHVRLGGIAVSAGYTSFSPGFYPNIFPYGPIYYPFTGVWWDPFWGFYPPFPAGYFSQGNGKGELKLSGAPKNASVYLNGGYAGTADHLKSFWLDPGVYDLEVSVPGGRRYAQRVYVLTGRTLHIDANPMSMNKEGGQL